MVKRTVQVHVAMRQTDGQQPTDGIMQTFLVDAAMQTDADSNPRRRRRPHEGPAAHAAMLEAGDEQLLRPLVRLHR